MEEDLSKQKIQQLEEQLHIELLPGTEIMADIGSLHFVKNRSSNVLVPQPTADKHDPLNWSLAWKTSTIVTASFVTFAQVFAPLSLAPMFGDYIVAFHTDLAGAVQFTGVAILVLGFSNFIWVPLSTSFGRRPVYLASQLVCFGSAIWRARAQTYGSFMGACVLNGIGAGPAETIEAAVITDIFFLHDRGKWYTVYWVINIGSLMISPIIAGAMAQYVGWRNFWWLNVALLGLAFLMVQFMFPETKWHRVRLGDGYSSVTSSEKPDGKATRKVGILGELNHIESPPTESQLEHVDTAERDPWLGRGSPSKQQWKLFQPNAHPLRSIILDLWLPWKLFAFPISQFASFVVSWSCSSFLTLNLTQTQAFAAPPYLWSTQSIGFTNFAIFAGALFGLATAGPLSDWVSARATKRNGGIREPEMRLPAMIPYVIIMFLGNIVVSVGYQHHWPWEAIVLIGYTCAGIQVAGLPGIVSTYAVDSYKPVAGSLFVSITVVKNLWGYGLSKFITNWVIADGYIPPIMTNASLIFLWSLFGILFYYKGKTFRRWTKNSFVHRL